jgi:hypothetical protein
VAGGGFGIKKDGKEKRVSELTLNGEPVELSRLININLDFTAGERPILQLNYLVDEIDVELDDSEVILHDTLAN